MSAREPGFRDAVRRRYNQIDTIWDGSDLWHVRVRTEIDLAVDRLNRMHPDAHELVVDIGSGGEPKSVPSRRYLQLDLAEDRLRQATSALVTCADAHLLPLRDASSDCLLCLGSVANYCSLIELVEELGRICMASGHLVFHVELSNSLEYLFRKEFRATATPVDTHYQGRVERTWVYSYRNVRQALANAGFQALDVRLFHLASALAYRLGATPDRAAGWACLDPFLRRVPGISALADSVIIICRKAT